MIVNSSEARRNPEDGALPLGKHNEKIKQRDFVLFLCSPCRRRRVDGWRRTVFLKIGNLALRDHLFLHRADQS